MNRIALRVLDLFCGAGGFTQGFVDAGFDVIAGIDHWKPAIDTYKANHSHHSLCKDLTTYPPEDLSKDIGITQNSIDIIIGGPPCQGFSNAGRRDVNDPRNSLFIEYVKYLDYFRPKIFIMENVIGILSMKTTTGEKCIDIITSILNKNYNTVVSKLSASDFEVPQNRRRVLIFGVRKDLNILPTEPILTFPKIPVSTVLEDRDKVPEKYFLSERAITGINQRKQKMKDQGKGFGAQFLDLDRPSYTISARYWKDGYDALVKYSDTEIRRLMPVELARIQTFPKDYKFSGTTKEVIIQIGNAVACRFAYHVAQHVKNILDEPHKNSIPCETWKTKNVKELKQLCKEKGIVGYSKMRRPELINALST